MLRRLILYILFSIPCFGAQPNNTTEDLAESLTTLLKKQPELLLGTLPADTARHRAKVIQIKTREHILETTILAMHGLKNGQKRSESHYEIKSSWDISNGIEKIFALTHRTNTLSTSTGGVQFHDVSGQTFGRTQSYANEVAPDLGDWVERIQTIHGIDIGGWEGLAVGDINGDRLDDLYLCQPGGLPNKMFIQAANQRMKDVSAISRTDWTDRTHAALLIDYDNDGDQDLVTAMRNGVMFQTNTGDAIFKDQWSVLMPEATPYSLCAADYDEDGDLDVFACAYNQRGTIRDQSLFAHPIPYHDATNGGRNILLRNEGNGRFRDVTQSVGLHKENQRFSYAASWEDYDRDGDLDLYVANDFGANNLYRNEGGPGRLVQFTDVARESGVRDIAAGMSVSWGDPNNDGHPDLYIGNMFSSAGTRVTDKTDFMPTAGPTTRKLYQRHARGNTLFSNQGDGRFNDIPNAGGAILGQWAWSSLFCDVNNDGWEDILVANGFITQSDSGDL